MLHTDCKNRSNYLVLKLVENFEFLTQARVMSITRICHPNDVLSDIDYYALADKVINNYYVRHQLVQSRVRNTTENVFYLKRLLGFGDIAFGLLNELPIVNI